MSFLMEKVEDEDKSRSPSPQQRALSSSPPPTSDSDNHPRSGVVSQSTSTVQRPPPSSADIAGRVATGADTSAASDQPSRRRDHRLVNNPTTAVPAIASTTRPGTTRDRDTSELDTATKTRSRDGQPPAVADEALGEGNTIRPHAPRVDRIPSTHPSLKPSAHSAHALDQPSLSASPPSHVGPSAIAKTASSRTRTARGILPGGPDSDSRSGGAPSELPHAPDDVKGSAYPNEQSQSNPSASRRRPSPPQVRSASAVGSPSQPQPVSGPRSLDRSISRIRGNEEVEREAKRATEGSTLGKTERKRTTTSQEPESQQESSATDSYNAQRRKPESSPLSSFASHSQRYPKTVPESSAESMHSYSLGHGPGSSTSHLPKDGESRGVRRPSDSLLSLGTQEVSLAPPTASLSASTQNLPKHATGVLSRNNPTGSSAGTNPSPPTAVGSQIRAAPPFSRTTSSRVSAPTAPITSQEAPKEGFGETRPGPILPSKSVGQPSPATVPPIPQKGPYTGSPRKGSSDSSSRLPEDRRPVETHVPSVMQVDSSRGAVGNKPQAKPSDGVGLAQPSARTEPSMINNTREARVSRAQPPDHSISQQGPQPESRVPPNEQYRVDPLIARQTGVPSEPAAPVSAPSSQYELVPVMAYLRVPIGNHPSPPPYERSAPLGAPVSQEGTSSTPGAGISSETRDEPNKSSALLAPAVSNDSSNLKGKARKNDFGESVAPELPPHSDGQSQMDRSGDVKRLLVPSEKEATAAVCPPDEPQSVAVYDNYERSGSAAPIISKSSSEFQQKQQHWNPSRGNLSDLRMEPSSDLDSERHTNQSTPPHLGNSNVSVTGAKPNKKILDHSVLHGGWDRDQERERERERERARQAEEQERQLERKEEERQWEREQVQERGRERGREQEREQERGQRAQEERRQWQWQREREEQEPPTEMFSRMSRKPLHIISENIHSSASRGPELHRPLMFSPQTVGHGGGPGPYQGGQSNPTSSHGAPINDTSRHRPPIYHHPTPSSNDTTGNGRRTPRARVSRETFEPQRPHMSYLLGVGHGSGPPASGRPEPYQDCPQQQPPLQNPRTSNDTSRDQPPIDHHPTPSSSDATGNTPMSPPPVIRQPSPQPPPRIPPNPSSTRAAGRPERRGGLAALCGCGRQ